MNTESIQSGVREKEEVSSLLDHLLKLMRSRANKRKLYNVKEANNRVSAIIGEAAKGTPQYIQKRNGPEVMVVRVDVFEALVVRAGKPKSFADKFPVTADTPPVKPLKISPKAGRAEVRF